MKKKELTPEKQAKVQLRREKEIRKSTRWKHGNLNPACLPIPSQAHIQIVLRYFTTDFGAAQWLFLRNWYYQQA